MLKVKKTTYGSLQKNNKLTKLTTEFKQPIQKTEGERNKKNKTISDYAKLIQSKKKSDVSTSKWGVKEKSKKTRR